MKIKKYHFLVVPAVLVFSIATSVAFTELVSGHMLPFAKVDVTSGDDAYGEENVDTPDDTNAPEMTPEEELQFLDDAEHQVDQLKQDIRTFKTSLTKCQRVRKSRSGAFAACLTKVYDQVAADLQAICAYRDAFPDAIGTACVTLGDQHVDSTSEDFDAATDVVPFVRDFIKAFGVRFFTSSVKEISERRTEIQSENGDEDSSDSAADDTVDTGSQSAESAGGTQDNQCFDHNYKSYLSSYCIELRKAAK